MEDITGVLVRISIAYLYVLALLRLSGKRSIGMLSPWDFMVALVLSDTFDDIIWGDIAVSQWFVGVATLMGLHLLVSCATFKSKTLDRILGSNSVPVVRSGRFDHEGLARERLRRETVLSQLRLQGVHRVTDIKRAIREPSGETSVLKTEKARPVQKADLPRLRKAA